MLDLIRHSHKHLRLWLIAAAAVLLLTTVIEAGHAHGIVSDLNDNCVLCQHSDVLDQQILVGDTFTPLADVAGLICITTLCFVLHSSCETFRIRAPPTQLHTR